MSLVLSNMYTEVPTQRTSECECLEMAWGVDKDKTGYRGGSSFNRTALARDMGHTQGKCMRTQEKAAKEGGLQKKAVCGHLNRRFAASKL